MSCTTTDYDHLIHKCFILNFWPSLFADFFSLITDNFLLSKLLAHKVEESHEISILKVLHRSVSGCQLRASSTKPRMNCDRRC